MKLIILDRDGVINYDSKHYIKSPDEWIEIPSSLSAIAKLHQAGYTIAVASNQSGIARGLYDETILQAIHQKMLALIEQAGGRIDKIVYCPHHPDDQCDCRKPQPGLLQSIADHYQCSLAGIPFVGDKLSDVETALAVDALPIFLNHGQHNHQLAPHIKQYPLLTDWVDEYLTDETSR